MDSIETNRNYINMTLLDKRKKITVFLTQDDFKLVISFNGYGIKK